MERITKKLIKGSAWVTIGKAVLGLATLATNALLTRLLPPDTIGVYFIVFSLVSGLALIAQAGMQHAVVRLVAEARSAGNKHLVTSIIHSAYSVVLVTTVLVCVAFSGGAGAWISNRVFDLTIPNVVVYIASAWLAALAFRSLIAETFRGLQDIKYATLFVPLSLRGKIESPPSDCAKPPIAIQFSSKDESVLANANGAECVPTKPYTSS